LERNNEATRLESGIGHPCRCLLRQGGIVSSPRSRLTPTSDEDCRDFDRALDECEAMRGQRQSIQTRNLVGK
jgi:hypothetical protein